MGNLIMTTIELAGMPAGAIKEVTLPACSPVGGTYTTAEIDTAALRDAGMPDVAEAIEAIGFDDADCNDYDLDEGRVHLYEELNYGTGRVQDEDLPEKLRDAGIAFRFYDDGDGVECCANEIAWEPGWPDIRRRDAISDGDIAIGQAEATSLLKTCADYEEFGRRVAEHLDLPDLARSDPKAASS